MDKNLQGDILHLTGKQTQGMTCASLVQVSCQLKLKKMIIYSRTECPESGRCLPLQVSSSSSLLSHCLTTRRASLFFCFSALYLQWQHQFFRIYQQCGVPVLEEHSCPVGLCRGRSIHSVAHVVAGETSTEQ